ncbi:hypothetical protein BD769DRAFT_1631555 [Suillus cothurnatus]|nr:hypothetical protein BD769DRAFT_1631555 [Suillus cothurnatus]
MPDGISHVQLKRWAFSRICDENGNFLNPGTPPPYTAKSPDDWTPYCNRLEFECADFIYTENQMSAGDINKILYLWGITLAVHHDNLPFADYRDLYNTIDATPLGDVAWENFSLKYNGNKPTGECPLWMEQSYEVWFQDPHTVAKNMLTNPDFKNGIDYTPYCEFQEKDEQCRYKDFMSADWAWQQADEIAQDPQTHGAAFVPIIIGSNKTTVSVATSQNDYYPLYLSIGNVHNNIWQAHCNALALVGFLAIPKSIKKKNSDDIKYHKFKKQLFHSLLSKIFANLKPGMTTPEVTRCGDGHYWCIIYGLGCDTYIGPYIADYKEQVVLACMVKDWCGRCLAFPSSLDEGGISWSREHTDALVDSVDFGILWDEYGIIGELVPFTNDFPRADIHELLTPDILHQLIKGTFKDHLVEWVGQYLKLTHGKTWRGFSQWTGDDSKALMKVYLPAIEGHVPDNMVRAFRALLEFCYIVCADVVMDDTLTELKDALRHFHTYHTIFQTTGYNALSQMLLTNQCLDKIAAARVDFTMHGMLKGSCAFSYYNSFCELDIPSFPTLIHLFLYDQIHADDHHSFADVPLCDCPSYMGPIKIFHSAAATFVAPSDPSGITGMRHQHIHATPSWHNGPARFDCAFVNTDDRQDGMLSMDVVQIFCFFSFTFTNGRTYPCALIHWFYHITEERDELTGMWMVAPSFNEDGSHDLSIIHIDSIICSAHLLPIFGMQFVPRSLQFYDSLDVYRGFYVSRFIDHHAFVLAS